MYRKQTFAFCGGALNMKILCPITSEHDILSLQPHVYETEFFCGYIPSWWIKKYNNSKAFFLIESMSTPINNRNVLKANFTDINSLKSAIQNAIYFDTEIILALNAKYYPEYVYGDLKRYIEEVYIVGIKKMIVCDVGVISFLSENYPEIKVYVSCLNQVTNAMAVLFYSRFPNVERIVFPRHMSVKEISSIVQKYPTIDFEYFIFSNKCLYDDGHCRGVHEFTPICKDIFESSYCRKGGRPLSNMEEMELRKSEKIYREWTRNEVLAEKKGYCTPNFACSACSLIELIKYPNIKSVKLSIRGHGIDRRLRQVQMARGAIECAKNGGTKKEIQHFICKMYGKENLCKEGMACFMC